MSMFKRLVDMASNALEGNDKSSTQGQKGQVQGNQSQGGSDWRDLVRNAADKLTGDARTQDAQTQSTQRDAPAYGTSPHDTAVPDYGRRPETSARPAASTQDAVDPADRAAIARYDYLLKTADPEQLEKVHLEAFANLTPAQRAQVEARLRETLPAGEQPHTSSPEDLARAATRGEARKPGFLRGLFSKPGAGKLAGAGAVGLGVGAAGGLLAAVAGGAIVSSVAGPLLEQAAGLGFDFDSLAGGVEGLAGGVEGLAGGVGEQVTGLTEGVSEQFGGVGEQLGGLGEQLGGFEIPGLGGLGDLFGR